MSSTDPPSFNLIHEPWIEVITDEGETTTVSILQALETAHRIKTIAGEVPTQQVAIIRLLLAILLRAFPTETPAVTWAKLWDRGEFSADAITTYLGRHVDRFDLLHPTHPFHQVADLLTTKGEFTSVARLIADVPAGAQFFTTRTARSYDRLSLAEAARWLVHAQCFDPSGIKSGALGDDRVKGGKGYPIGVAWCGWLGIVLIEGENLFETLMLNLRLDDTQPEDRPVWERNPLGPGIEVGHSTPVGPADLFTWPSRRIRLQTDADAVVGVLLCNGDPLHPLNLHRIEPMTAWRHSAPQAKRSGESMAFMPTTHVAQRGLWLGLSGMFGGVSSEAHATGLAPRSVEWLARLQADGYIDPEILVKTRAFGLEYGTQSSLITDLIDDTLTVHAAFLADPELRRIALDGVLAADAAAKALADLARDTVHASGGEQEGPPEAARAAGYSALDIEFRPWVRDLTVSTTREAALADWHTTVWRVVSDLARPVITDAGPSALAGRVVKRANKPTLINAPIAERWFQARLSRALPHRRKESRSV